MKIAIAGGTGFVGKALTKKLLELGHSVIILTRNSKKYSGQQNITYVDWLKDGEIPKLPDIDVFINLAGESINTRWTANNKRKIVDSRLQSTELGISLMESLPAKPKVYIQASAIGIYGTSLSDTFTEETTKTGTDFLATTVQQWEEKAIQGAEKLNVRTVLCRFGLILHNKEGALPKMALPYQLYAGGKMGSGKQWMSWIHIDDVVDGILFVIENDNIEGPVNFTAPHPVTMDNLGRALSKQLKKPHWFPVPSFMLKAILGEMSILVLEGQKVLPNKLLHNGYSFHYNHIHEALANLYK